MIWVLIAAAALIAVAALVWPLFKTTANAQPRAAYDLAVFQDQLTEVDRDLARGVLTAAEAKAARLEIQRRMIGAAKAPQDARAQDSARSRGLLAAILAFAVPMAALGLYLIVGSPDLRGSRPTAGGHDEAEINHMLDQLAAKVASDPNNVEGVALLARSYRQVGRFAEATATYRRLLALKPDAETWASYGEVIIAAAGGDVGKDAHDAMVKALVLDRNEPRARFYLGLEQAEKGDAKAAIAVWRELTASSPADAPWLPMVREEMSQVAQEAAIPPMTVTPQHPLDLVPAEELAAARQQTGAPPAPPQTAAVPPAATAAAPPATASAGSAPGATPDASSGFSPQQLQMIQGMVSGLAAKLEQNPNDYDGWMMLGRSYTVLSNADGAAKAYEKAIALRPKELPPKLQYVALVMTTTDPDAPAPLPETLTKTATDILALDPKQPNALYVAGLARAKAGDKAGARTYWDKAQSGLPDNAPLKSELARRLKALD